MDNEIEKRIKKLEDHERITGVILGVTFGISVIIPIVKYFLS